MMEDLVSCAGISDYEDLRGKMSIAFDTQYRKKPADLFTYEPIPKHKLKEFMEWMASDD